MAERSTWLESVVRCLDRAAQLVSGADEALLKRGAAVATTDGPSDTGWFRIAMRVSPSDLDRMDDAVLAPESGHAHESYAVVAAEVQDGSLHVRTLGGDVAHHLYLYTPRLSPKRFLLALKDGLQALPVGSLAEHIGGRRLDPVPAVEGPIVGYNDDQRQALQACTAPGLQVVWGPPGTGKTHVIAGAMHRLRQEGKRVLLVSSTNVAVDNALQMLIRRISPSLQPGEVVRVGTPHVAAIAADDRVTLAAIANDRLAHRRAEVERLASEAARLRKDEATARRKVDDAKAALRSFDRRAYQDALGRRRNHDTLMAAQETLRQERETLTTVEAELDAARREVSLAELTCAILDEQSALATAEDARAAWASWRARSGIRRTLSLPATRRARQRYESTSVAASAATTRRREIQETLGSSAPVMDVPPPTSPAFATRDAEARRDLALTREATDRAENQATASRRLLATRGAEAATAASAPQPTPDDLRLVDQVERAHLPALDADLPRLEQKLAGIRIRLQTVESARQAQEAAAKRERGTIERTVVGEARVVATTLTMLTLKQVVTAARYDHVIIDEAAAATLAHIAHAVGLATTGACLLGDFFQNGPIAHPRLQKAGDRDRSIAELFLTDCFSYFGLTNPVEAQQTAGCVVLTEQHRFGAAITELANRTCYGGLLHSANDRVPCEIVLLDVDGLGSSLAAVRREAHTKGRWAIGALVARALGELHAEQGHSIGVVVPYKSQERASIDALDESDVGASIEVGTSHAFQGREFDVVVFDTVEDGLRDGWVALGAFGQGPWQLDGLRLFNVATTRARRRLYIVANGAAVARASAGPLSHVRALIDQGLATRESVRDLLGLGKPPPTPTGSSDNDIRRALARFVRTEGIYDQDALIDALRERIDGARTSVWLWSPWVGRYATTLQDALVRAHERGVDVRLVALPEEGLTRVPLESLHRIRRRLPNTVLVHRMHEKLVLVDKRRSFVGSMNVLSHEKTPSKRRQELMIALDSTSFARDLLVQERGDELFKVATCPTCRQRMWQVRRYADRGTNRTAWYWVCRDARAGKPCPGRLKFSSTQQAIDWIPATGRDH